MHSRLQMPGIPTLKAAILTYHSQNIAGSETGNNDHHALAADLEVLHAAGCRFVSLTTLVNGIFADDSAATGQPLICLTFDDGCDYDVRTLEFPPHGSQTGFLQIMEGFIKRHGSEAQSGLHATSFVIASPHARQLIDNTALSLSMSFTGALHKEENSFHSIGNTLTARVGDHMEFMLGYDIKLGDPDKAGLFDYPGYVPDRDAVTLGFTWYFM